MARGSLTQRNACLGALAPDATFAHLRCEEFQPTVTLGVKDPHIIHDAAVGFAGIDNPLTAALIHCCEVCTASFRRLEVRLSKVSWEIAETIRRLFDAFPRREV